MRFYLLQPSLCCYRRFYTISRLSPKLISLFWYYRLVSVIHPSISFASRSLATALVTVWLLFYFNNPHSFHHQSVAGTKNCGLLLGSLGVLAWSHAYCCFRVVLRARKSVKSFFHTFLLNPVHGTNVCVETAAKIRNSTQIFNPPLRCALRVREAWRLLFQATWSVVSS